VKAVHLRAAECKAQGRVLIVLGDAAHPEVAGIVGYAERCVVVSDENAPALASPDGAAAYTLVAQTTQSAEAFERLAEALRARGFNVIIHNTICEATVRRQAEAEELSKSSDAMVVLGDAGSANTRKLCEICRRNCARTYMAQTIADIQLQFFSNNDKIGITAGASTPPGTIKEALLSMSEWENNNQAGEGQGFAEPPRPGPAADDEANASAANDQSFEEMLNESFLTLHAGDVVKGTVIQVTNNEVTVNLGYKSDGIIAKNEFTDDNGADLTALVKTGDTVEVLVMRVNDGEGNVLVSKRRLDAQTNYKVIEQAFIDKTTVVGRIQDLVKGGLIASVHGNRVFVPSSQISDRYVEDLSVFKGKEFEFNILEFDRSKRRIVAGRKELAALEHKQRRDELFATLTVGQKLHGVVSRITDFGAFIDLGGVDGLVHISELAWRRVRKVTDVLSVGEEVDVTVIDINAEMNKISLSLKDINNNPWNNIAERFPVGSIVEGTVVRMAPFGAFVNIEEGIDGLVHVSQIADRHIVRPEDELSINQRITVKVTDVDEANKKISLSKKAAEALYDDDYEDYDGEARADAGEEDAPEAAEEAAGEAA
jgi:4-hydroxy-3-methylbut-2-enyl diphosphate reductase